MENPTGTGTGIRNSDTSGFISDAHYPMFKKLFNGLAKSKTPRPEDLILEAIRARLLPLGFIESYDAQYHQSGFTRNDLSVQWRINLKDEHFYFMLKKQGHVIVTMNSPWYIKIDENKWGEYKEQVLQKLGDWLATVQAHSICGRIR